MTGSFLRIKHSGFADRFNREVDLFHISTLIVYTTENSNYEKYISGTADIQSFICMCAT